MNLHSLLKLVILAVALLSTGCGVLKRQKDPTRYFALKATSTGRISSSKLAVGIGPVTIPGYLDHDEIVTAGSANDLKLADYDVWAEPMEKAVTRVVAKNVSRLLDSPSIVPFPDTDLKQDYRTIIIIRRFEMGADSKVRLDASYTIEGGPGSNRSGSAHSRSITIGVAQPENYAVVVDAMSRAMGELSGSIARDLLALDRKHPKP